MAAAARTLARVFGCTGSLPDTAPDGCPPRSVSRLMPTKPTSFRILRSLGRTASSRADEDVSSFDEVLCGDHFPAEADTCSEQSTAEGPSTSEGSSPVEEDRIEDRSESSASAFFDLLRSPTTALVLRAFSGAVIYPADLQTMLEEGETMSVVGARNGHLVSSNVPGEEEVLPFPSSASEGGDPDREHRPSMEAFLKLYAESERYAPVSAGTGSHDGYRLVELTLVRDLRGWAASQLPRWRQEIAAFRATTVNVQREPYQGERERQQLYAVAGGFEGNTEAWDAKWDIEENFLNNWVWDDDRKFRTAAGLLLSDSEGGSSRDHAGNGSWRDEDHCGEGCFRLFCAPWERPFSPSRFSSSLWESGDAREGQVLGCGIRVRQPVAEPRANGFMDTTDMRTRRGAGGKWEYSYTAALRSAGDGSYAAALRSAGDGEDHYSLKVFLTPERELPREVRDSADALLAWKEARRQPVLKVYDSARRRGAVLPVGGDAGLFRTVPIDVGDGAATVVEVRGGGESVLVRADDQHDAVEITGAARIDFGFLGQGGEVATLPGYEFEWRTI